MPDAFLALLCCKVMYSTEHSFAISGDLIADSVVSFRASTFDLVNPLPGSSKDGDSVIPLICNIVGVSTSFLPLVVGAGAGRSAGVSGYLYALPTPPPPLPGFASFPSVASSLLAPPPPVSSASCSSFFFWFCSSSSSTTFVVRLPSSFPLPYHYCPPFCCSCCLPSFFFSFVRSSDLSSSSSCLSLPSLSAAWSSLSFWSFRGLLFLFFSFFSPFVGSSYFLLLLPFGSATNERQDDGAGILHQVAQFPIDQVYSIYKPPMPLSAHARPRETKYWLQCR